MAQEPQEVVIHDRQLTCHHCGGQGFYHRAVAIKGARPSVFDLDWYAAHRAFCYTCSECGHVHWFMAKV